MVRGCLVCYSLRGRRLKGKGKGVLGKGVLGARETRGAREGDSRAQNSLSLPFQTPATQAKSATQPFLVSSRNAPPHSPLWGGA